MNINIVWAGNSPCIKSHYFHIALRDSSFLFVLWYSYKSYYWSLYQVLYNWRIARQLLTQSVYCWRLKLKIKTSLGLTSFCVSKAFLGHTQKEETMNKAMCFVTTKTINIFICLINVKEKPAIQFWTAWDILFFSIFISFPYL